MTTNRIGRWLLVAIAIVGLAFTASLVSAHGNDTAADDTTAGDAPTANGTAADWTTWMEGHMTDHMGPGSVEWMESHTGVTVDEMAQGMADEDYHSGMYGQGHC